MPADDPKVMNTVAEALKRTDPAARATYLDSVCGDDADFRAQVEALIATHDAAGRPVEAGATGMHESTSPETLGQTPAPDAADWPEGQPLRIEKADYSEMPVEEIDRDFAVLASLCSESEPANEDQLDRALHEARRQAKEQVRRAMGLN
jgi:hypothetical protein